MIIKDLLFSSIGYLGVIFVVVRLFVMILEEVNKVKGIVKYIIMYREYSKNKELYTNKNNLIITRKGRVLYSCATNSLEDKIEILKKSIEHCHEMMEIRDNI